MMQASKLWSMPALIFAFHELRLKDTVASDYDILFTDVNRHVSNSGKKRGVQDVARDDKDNKFDNNTKEDELAVRRSADTVEQLG